MAKNSNPVIFIVGTTASGKSDWAVKLAQEFHGVVVNCDSIQVYRKLDVGSAKPSKEDQALVPHYLLDYVNPPEEMTAGNYARDFFAVMSSLPEGVPAFVVGGTGFYFMAIEKGMYPVTKVSPELQKQVALELQVDGGSERLYQELKQVDPVYAAKLHAADSYRLGRAIELIRSQGKSVTQIQNEFEEAREQFPYPLLKLGPYWDREILRERIRRRTQAMLEQGLLAEVKGLLDQGLEGWAPLSSVGYKESLQFLRGELPEELLLEQISISTAQLAKRQRTWFQRDKDIHWFEGDSGFSEARSLVEKFLKT